MFPILLLMFVSIPLVELYVLIKVGAEIGALSTIALCLFTAALGAFLIRVQGFSTLMKARADLEREEVPALAMIEGVFLVIAGLLLMTPGLVTDAFGFLCLIPPLRQAWARGFLERRSSRIHPGPGFQRGPAGPGHGQGQRTVHVIEGEFKREDDNRPG